MMKKLLNVCWGLSLFLCIACDKNGDDLDIEQQPFEGKAE